MTKFQTSLKFIEFYSQFVKEDGSLLGCLPIYMIDYELCLLSVRNTWRALEFVPSHFLSEEIIVAGYDQDPRAIQFLCPTINESLFLPLKIQREMECSLRLKIEVRSSSNMATTRRLDCI